MAEQVESNKEQSVSAEPTEVVSEASIDTASVPQVEAPAEKTEPVAAAEPTPVVDSGVTADSSLEASARSFGRVDESGTVWVKEASGERAVGQFPEEVPADPLQLYVRRYLDLLAQVDLFAQRLPHLGNRDIDQTLKSLKESLAEPAAVGDLDSLRNRLGELEQAAEARRVEIREQRAKAKEEALAKRTAIVEEAEKIAGQNPERTQWKQSGQRLRDLLEEWKQSQRNSPRLERSVEDGLWKRFSSARTQFDRHRRQYFSALDAAQADAKRAKEKLVQEAEELSKSTDWGPTHSAYLKLMDRWKAAGRASRKDDDALWDRFNAARQVFYDARQARSEAVDAQQQDNLKAKEAIVEQAEKLLPITDIAAAKAALRPLQDKWDEIGFVPISARDKVESRLRAVEDAIKEAEEAEWRRSNPETKARAEGMLGQLEEAIEELEKELAEAKAKGDKKAQKKAEEALEARKAWLAQVKSVTE